MEKRNYSNSELFTVANNIRKETGCSRSEAYYKAKDYLENKNTFNAEKALKGAKVMTKSGKTAKVICETRGKLLVKVYSKVASYLDREIKYNMDGSRWSPNVPDPDDLVMA